MRVKPNTQRPRNNLLPNQNIYASSIQQENMRQCVNSFED